MISTEDPEPQDPRAFWRPVLVVFAGLTLASAAFAAFLFHDFAARIARGEGVNNVRQRPQDRPAPAAASELPVYVQVPDFALVERSGAKVARADLLGKVWVVDFIFTHCSGQCPMMAARLKRLREAIGDAPDVRLVSVTVDPVRDTPAVLADYARALGVEDPRWLFLTGEKDAIVKLVLEGLKLPAVVSGPEGSVDVTHSDRFVLVDRRGRIRGYYGAEDEEAQARLPADVRRLLAE